MAGPKRVAQPPAELRDVRHRAVKHRLAARLRELRTKHELTREALAEASDVGFDLIVKLEGATSGGSVDTWADLAHALGEPLEAMFCPPTPSGAREPTTYHVKPEKPQRPSPVQLSDLSKLASELDRDTVAALLVLVRRMRPR